MKRDYVKRKAAYAAPTADPSTLSRSERIMVGLYSSRHRPSIAEESEQLYIHGGAYFFS